MSDATATVSCLCGGLRFSVDLPAKKVGHCHCVNCRRSHGAGLWTWAEFGSDRVRLVAGAGLLRRYTCDVGSTRSFCGTCGSTLLYESPRWPDKCDLSVANFDQELAQLPTRHAYADRSTSWCPITDDLQQLGGESGMEPLG